MNNQYPREFEDDKLDSVEITDPVLKAASRMQPFPNQGFAHAVMCNPSLHSTLKDQIVQAERIRQAEEKLQRAFENFAAQWGEAEMQRVKAHCEEFNLGFDFVADLYAQVKAAELMEQNRREELRVAVAQLAQVATYTPPSGKHGRSEIDRIPVPKRYKRNRFKR